MGITLTKTTEFTPTMLFVAHPGHELRIHGWLRQAKPVLSVLTAGSRSTENPARIEATVATTSRDGLYLDALGGQILDKDFYRLIKVGNVVPFHSWVDQLARQLTHQRARRLVVDGYQLYSITHDVAHGMGRVAAAEASKALGWEIEVLHYPVVPFEIGGAIDFGQPAFAVALSETEFQAKLAAIEAYPDIKAEFDEVVRIEGLDASRTETFFRPPPMSILVQKPQSKPAYEHFGELRVAKGLYQSVLRWHHVEAILQPLLDRLDGVGGR